VLNKEHLTHVVSDAMAIQAELNEIGLRVRATARYGMDVVDWQQTLNLRRSCYIPERRTGPPPTHLAAVTRARPVRCDDTTIALDWRHDNASQKRCIFF
jgi:hypothetical protein